MRIFEMHTFIANVGSNPRLIGADAITDHGIAADFEFVFLCQHGRTRSAVSCPQHGPLPGRVHQKSTRVIKAVGCHNRIDHFGQKLI